MAYKLNIAIGSHGQPYIPDINDYACILSAGK